MCNIKRHRYTCKHIRTSPSSTSSSSNIQKCKAVKKSALKEFGKCHGKVKSKLGRDGEFLFAKGEEEWITNWVGTHKCEGRLDTLWFQVRGNCPSCREALGPKKIFEDRGERGWEEEEVDKAWEREQKERIFGIAPRTLVSRVERVPSVRGVTSSRAGSARSRLGEPPLTPFDSISNTGHTNPYRCSAFEHCNISAPQWDDEECSEDDEGRECTVSELDSDDGAMRKSKRKSEMKEAPARSRAGAVPTADMRSIISRRSDDTFYRAASPRVTSTRVANLRERATGTPSIRDLEGPTLLPDSPPSRISPTIVTASPGPNGRLRVGSSASSRRATPKYPDVQPQYPKMRQRRDF